MGKRTGTGPGDKRFWPASDRSRPRRRPRKSSKRDQTSDFNWKKPQPFAPVLGGLAAHHAGLSPCFGRIGYRLRADWLIQALIPVEPAKPPARMCSAFQTLEAL